DCLEPDLRHLVDRDRQHVGRKAVTVARERVDQRTAVCFVVQQQNRLHPVGLAIGREQRAQLAHERVGGRQRVGGGAGRAGGGAAPAARAYLGVNRHVVAGGCDRGGRA